MLTNCDTFTKPLRRYWCYVHRTIRDVTPGGRSLVAPGGTIRNVLLFFKLSCAATAHVTMLNTDNLLGNEPICRRTTYAVQNGIDTG